LTDGSAGATDRRPLVVHVVYRFDTGGLENGVVNLINHLPDEAYRHAVVSLTEVTEFARRIRRTDVRCIALHKRPGHTWWLYPTLLRLFRELRPSIVHTRNLAALEVQPVAWLAGVPWRIHGEHGRDVGDLDGASIRYQRMRRLYRPFVHRYVALSGELRQYLLDKVHVSPERVTQIYNGVDTDRFGPVQGSRVVPAGCPFDRHATGWSAPSAACRPSSTSRCWRAPSCARCRCGRHCASACVW
jgi:sugar transferase (PEP-CTERM/EpsH1 system associated)